MVRAWEGCSNLAGKKELAKYANLTQRGSLWGKSLNIVSPVQTI